MQNIVDLIETNFGLSAGLQLQLFKTFILIVLMLVLYNLVKKLLYKSIKDSKTYYKTKKSVGYIFVGITFILIAGCGLWEFNL